MEGRGEGAEEVGGAGTTSRCMAAEEGAVGVEGEAEDMTMAAARGEAGGGRKKATGGTIMEEGR